MADTLEALHGKGRKRGKLRCCDKITPSSDPPLSRFPVFPNVLPEAASGGRALPQSLPSRQQMLKSGVCLKGAQHVEGRWQPAATQQLPHPLVRLPSSSNPPPLNPILQAPEFFRQQLPARALYMTVYACTILTTHDEPPLAGLDARPPS